MEAFILETLTATGWRRSGQTIWTIEAARKEAARLIRRKLALRVRILRAEVDPAAIVELPQAEAAPA